MRGNFWVSLIEKLILGISIDEFQNPFVSSFEIVLAMFSQEENILGQYLGYVKEF